MAARKSKTKNQYQLRVDQAAALYLEGKTPADIGETMACSERMVFKYIEKAREQWAARRNRGFDTKRDEELAILERTRAEAFDAWRRSKDATTEKTTKAESIHIKDGDKSIPGKKITATAKTVEHIGDPTFLSIALGASDQIRKLEGLDAPTKTDATLNIPQLGDHARLLHKDDAELDAILEDANKPAPV